MPRRKRKLKDKVPKYVCRGTSAWLYVPYVPGVKRKSYKLCSLDAPISNVWAAHERLVAKLSGKGEATGTLAWLLKTYKKSPQFVTHKGKDKSPKTIKDQMQHIDLICGYQLETGLFGDTALSQIQPVSIRLFLDYRAANGGAISGNRQVSLISKAWNWARERGKVDLANPCIGVTRNDKNPKQHYAEDDSYEGWLRYLESSTAPKYLYFVSELAYLCRMRKIECLTASKDQVLKNGFDTLRRKGSKDAITTYTPRLLKLVRACKALSDQTLDGQHCKNLITTDKGKPVTEAGFNSVWQRHMKLAVKKGYVLTRFTTHDLKRKGATDSDLPATISTGNTPAMDSTYDKSKLVAGATK